jgi:hypothetical protein
LRRSLQEQDVEVQHGQQQAYSVQDLAAHAYADPSQVQASVNYPNHLAYDSATINTAEAGRYPAQYTYDTNLPAGYATYGSNSAQGSNYSTSIMYAPQPSYGMLAMLITFH